MTKGETVEIIPTCVPQNGADLSECARFIRLFADEIHIDITDGLFAPSQTWPYTEKGVFGKIDLSGAYELVKEVHLMVEEPRTIGIEFARAGAFRILGHIEAFDNPQEAHGTLDAWKHAGPEGQQAAYGAGAREVGLAILMHTPFELLDPLIPVVDVVHMMSIATIGTQGIPYDREAPERIAAFHAQYPDVLISVDGGVSEKNIVDLVKAGARRFGVGSAIAKAKDPAAAYKQLKDLAESATLD